MKKIITGILIMLVFSAGCEDAFDINESPNNPRESTLEYTLPTGISGIAYVMGGWYNIVGQIWSQHWTQAPEAGQYRFIEQYDAGDLAASLDRQFTTMYTSLNDLEYVSENAEEEENWTYFLIAEAMKAYGFQVLTDLYGDVPYSEALSGGEGIIAPNYQSGDVIYDSLIIRLNNALSKDFDQGRAGGLGPTPVGSEDLVYGGDIDQWISFVNTLKLKIYLRQYAERPEVAEEGIAELYSSGAEFLTATAAMTQFINEQNRRNPFYETEVDRFSFANIIASATAIDFLVDNADPRIDDYYVEGDEGFLGLEQGYYNLPGAMTDDYAQPNVSATDPVVFISAAESYFLQAEAAVRYPGITAGADAEALYQAGIEAAFARVGEEGASALYEEDGIYEFPETEEEQIEAIITQKWVAFTNTQGIEAFLEFNRTGYPTFLVPSQNNVTGDRFPRRLPLPADERAENPNSPSFQEIYVPVWWDVD